MKIRFKVVDKYRGSFLVPETSPYYLRYKKGHITKALKDTIGVMVFDTIESAKDYAKGLSMKFEILEVDARGRMKKISGVSSGAGTEDLDKFYENRSINIMVPFPGTECYPRVKVLT
jgi:hypothetical protein